jgi:hypothetical protein
MVTLGYKPWNMDFRAAISSVALMPNDDVVKTVMAAFQRVSIIRLGFCFHQRGRETSRHTG